MASNCARNSGLFLIFSGCVIASPAAMAICFTGVAATCCVRPTGRSGCETTSAISWPAARNASIVDTAKRGVPQKTIFTLLPLAVALHLANLAQSQVAFERAHSKDEKHAVEMIDLMLECARKQLLAIHLEPFPLQILGADADLGGPHNLFANLGKAEAALLLVLPAIAEDDFRINDHQLLRGVFSLAQVDHGHAL